MQATGDRRQATGDRRQATSDKRRAASGERRAASEGRRAKGEGRRATNDRCAAAYRAKAMKHTPAIPAQASRMPHPGRQSSAATWAGRWTADMGRHNERTGRARSTRHRLFG
ncbi:hypothetical protein X992_5928 [Burkholderia pseudomallei MSHR5492]|nr:hypothetical protein X992_5928 [Burkholderia pseudomallei MSHR5492]